MVVMVMKCEVVWATTGDGGGDSSGGGGGGDGGGAKIEWQWMFVFGIFLGSLISSITSSSFRWQALPDMWESRFGTSRTKRAIIAFLGAAVAMFGARLAGD